MAVSKLFYLKIFLLLFLSSCKAKYGVDFYVTNKRDTTLHKIYLMPSADSLIIYNLKPGETKKVFMDFKGISKVDGCYGIGIAGSVSKNDNLIFGYYSNGMPMEKEIGITIHNDTFQMTSIFRKGY